MNQKESILEQKTGYNRFAIVLFIIALIVNAACWTVLFWKIPRTDATIFLHYNVYYGIDLTGKWQQLFLIPGTGLVILLVNTIIAFLWWQKDSFMQRLVCSITVLFEVMLCIAAVLVVLLNGYSYY